MKTLIVYYSFFGTTETIGKNIQHHMGADIVKLRAVRPYNLLTLYTNGVLAARCRRERAILPLEVDVSSYERIVLLTPVWVARPVPPVVAFLRNYDLTGKTVYAVAVNTGKTENVEDILKNEIESNGAILGGVTLIQCTTERMNALREDKAVIIFDPFTGKFDFKFKKEV